MPDRSPPSPSGRGRYPLLLLAVGLLAAAPAGAAPWWYAGRDDHSAVFVDIGSIERDGGVVRFAARQVIRRPGDPVAMTLDFVQVDCARSRIGWVGIQRFGADDQVIDTSTRADAEMAPPATPIDRAQLEFACADPAARERAGFFPLRIDDAAFTDALLGTTGNGMSPRALHDRMAASPETPVIRSNAPPPATFGTVQTVAVGQPLVPPRDYSRGAQIPDPADYPAIEVGRIYDIAFQGIKDGEIRFEIRGYSIDDLVHPGSGQTETLPLGQPGIAIRDIEITIRKASPDRLTYSVAVRKPQPGEPPCTAGCEAVTDAATQAH
ncbi:hypothetical protein TPR58_17375 [Sphingomonas sp. HF-S3]|uniref:Uncharacterized protein n=1 Tax=Sphingomonas rustica TaxID=3103142 RepID=A0ABV0BCI7_9SPHN